jgi:hypothetical protein
VIGKWVTWCGITSPSVAYRFTKLWFTIQYSQDILPIIFWDNHQIRQILLLCTGANIWPLSTIMGGVELLVDSPLIVGCYRLISVASAAAAANFTPTTTLQECLIQCGVGGSFAAVTAGVNCACFTTFPHDMLVPSQECTIDCPGDSTTICGGPAAYTIAIACKLISKVFKPRYCRKVLRQRDSGTRRPGRKKHWICSCVYFYSVTDPAETVAAGDQWTRTKPVSTRSMTFLEICKVSIIFFLPVMPQTQEH